MVDMFVNSFKYMSLLSMCLGYFIGNINPAYILSKYHGFDIREKGTGNAGASNAMINLGKVAGIFCAVFDVLKAYFAVKIASKLFPLLKIAGALAGAFCIIGHMYPVIMNFSGGKGLASLGGVLLAYDARLFVILLFLEVIVIIVFSYICLVPTTGSSILGIIMLIKDGPVYAFIFLPVVISIWLKHLVNFRRIKYGVEAKVSYLWNKDEEERIRKNFEKLTDDQKSYLSLYELN